MRIVYEISIYISATCKVQIFQYESNKVENINKQKNVYSTPVQDLLAIAFKEYDLDSGFST